MTAEDAIHDQQRGSSGTSSGSLLCAMTSAVRTSCSQDHHGSVVRSHQEPYSWYPTPSLYHVEAGQGPLFTDGITLSQSYQPPPPPISTNPSHSYALASHSQTSALVSNPGHNRQSGAWDPTRSLPTVPHARHSLPTDACSDYGGYRPSDDRNTSFYPTAGSSVYREMMSNQSAGQPWPDRSRPPYSVDPSFRRPDQWPPIPSDPYPQQMLKRVRAAEACDSCRQRKARCDEGRPQCGHCRKHQFNCVYRDVPPPEPKESILRVTEKVDKLGGKVDNMQEKMTNVTSDIKQQLCDIRTGLQALVEHTAADMGVTVGDSGDLSITNTGSRPQVRVEPRSDLSGFQGYIYVDGVHVRRKVPAVPINRTSVGRVPGPGLSMGGPVGTSDLLRWPTIKRLIPEHISGSYIMKGELRRGLLRLNGHGEERCGSHERDESLSLVSSASSCSMQEDLHPTRPSSDVLSTEQFLQGEGTNCSTQDHPRGETPAGQLVLDNATFDKYVRSYLEKISMLYLFLSPKTLRAKVRTFTEKYCWDHDVRSRLKQSVVISCPSKRKMNDTSNTATVQPPVHMNPDHNYLQIIHNTVPIEHSIDNALVLLVLALGAISAHEGPLPALPRCSKVATGTQDAQRIARSGDLTHPSGPTPCHRDSTRPTGVASASASSLLRQRNVDIVPGLAYFAKAATILGELTGGVDISHIQANLLAGIYMDQLTRVIPSYDYILNASRACQIMINTKAFETGTMPPEQRDCINFAFWSCLQLEGDILAEMGLCRSGIMDLECRMSHKIPSTPTKRNSASEHDSRQPPPKIFRHFSSQIRLRQLFNDAVNQIYDTQQDQPRPSRSIETADEALRSWRSQLNDWDWVDDQHESTDLNHARLRANYYGAKYIINRPALADAFSLGYPKRSATQQPSTSSKQGTQCETLRPTKIQSYNAAIPLPGFSERSLPTSVNEQLEDWIWEACDRCIQAAIKSTTSFDRVPGRLVVTNLMGIAHAQFGNILVLSATFSASNPRLRRMVPEDTLRELLGRTIRFLDDKKDISPTLSQDAEILRHVQEKLFPSANRAKYPSISTQPNSRSG